MTPKNAYRAGNVDRWKGLPSLLQIKYFLKAINITNKNNEAFESTILRSLIIELVINFNQIVLLYIHGYRNILDFFMTLINLQSSSQKSLLIFVSKIKLAIN